MRKSHRIITKVAIVMQSKPKAIPQVVVDKYPKVIRDDVLSLIGIPSPP